MKAIERWCAAEPFVRRFKVWTHSRMVPSMDGDHTETWWHVDLQELHREFADHGQAKRAHAWSNREITYTGYGPSLAEAARNALRRAKQGPPKEYAGGVC